MCRYNWDTHRMEKWTGEIRIKSVTMIDPVTGCFEMTQYNHKREISILNLVETMWLSRYPIPM